MRSCGRPFKPREFFGPAGAAEWSPFFGPGATTESSPFFRPGATAEWSPFFGHGAAAGPTASSLAFHSAALASQPFPGSAFSHDSYRATASPSARRVY